MSDGIIPEGYRVYPPRVNMYAETVGRVIAGGDGARPALVWADGSLTYDALDAEVGRVAAGLVEAGLERGQAILLRSNNQPAYPILVLAAFRIGVVAVMSSSLLQKDEVCLSAGKFRGADRRRTRTSGRAAAGACGRWRARQGDPDRWSVGRGRRYRL